MPYHVSHTYPCSQCGPLTSTHSFIRLLRPRSYVTSRIHTQPRLSGDIRDSTVQLSNMHFPSPGQSFDFPLLQEPPLASARKSSFISLAALGHNTNADPDNAHLSASIDFSPSSSSSTSTSDSQTTNASQLALPNLGSMSDRGCTEPAPFIPSGLSLLLARKRSPSRETDSSAFGSTPPFSPNLPPIEERSQSSSNRILQTHLASFTKKLSDTGYNDHRRSNACENTGREDAPDVASERTPLLHPRSPPHETTVTRSPSGPVLHKNSTIHGFPKRFRHWWTTLEPMGLDVLARTAILAIPAVLLGALLNVLDGLSCK